MFLLLVATVAIYQASASDLKRPICPEGMIYVSEGQFYMGRDSTKRKDEAPRHLIKLSPYCIASTLVTFKHFAGFVKKTGYLSTAEKNGWGMMSTEGMDDWAWKRIDGASWRAPFGLDLAVKIPMKDDYPVVSVSWYDAVEYCKSTGARLPTEAEWEYASRAGKSDKRFPWGNRPERPDGKLGLNFWQGKTHHKNKKDDGYLYLSPVKAFPPNAWGLYDPVGNVWQWTADWYSPDYYQKTNSPSGEQDPMGPTDGRKKVTRGGSWWCSDKTCSGFGLYFRGKTSPRAVFNNKGFRCAKNPD